MAEPGEQDELPPGESNGGTPGEGREDRVRLITSFGDGVASSTDRLAAWTVQLTSGRSIRMVPLRYLPDPPVRLALIQTAAAKRPTSPGIGRNLREKAANP
jgi:hypothetical protein